MSFEYSKYFGADAHTGYEVLLYDCMIGDATLFQRADMVEAGWSVVDPMLDVWTAWQETHASDEDVDLKELCEVKADYIRRALEAGLQAVELLPRPA